MSVKVDLYTQAGEKKGQIALPEEMFGVSVNAGLMHQALVRQLANGRYNLAHTQTKGEVSGGGRKPYKQKGTGNARQGSITNPHWKGGGVSHGPRAVRNFSLMMPKKQRRIALFSALSLKVQEKMVFALEKYEAKEMKTKAFAEMLGKLPVKRDAVLVLAERNEAVERSARNLPNVKTIFAGYINLADLQKYDNVILMQDSVKKLEEIFLSK